MNFRIWLENFGDFTIGGMMQGGENKAYAKGVRDAQDDNYDPPSSRSQMQAQNRTMYIDGWRAMGKHIPSGKHGQNIPDRIWYQNRLRVRNFAGANPGNLIDMKVMDDPQWDDPEYEVDVG